MATAQRIEKAIEIGKLRLCERTRIGLCVSEWNDEITEGLRKGAMELLEKVLKPEQIITINVPGTFELALSAQMLFESHDLDAVICIGSVIRGETAHFDYVCQAAAAGITEVGLKYSRPCVFCVLTDDNIEQSRARSGGKLGNKGTEAAEVALKMISLNNTLLDR